ncbi:MAG: pyruvate kinase [Candidatus Lokiarchaeota archaeon]|nr:pyruvate kinase [Candidatus Lokiarchaeota archaeon]MBD3338224.1 pyruvate kinase [Candidatus Lokiarchaeota archaeon]
MIKEDSNEYRKLLRENTVKIVATLGPASNSEKMLNRLINAGVDVFRLNFSHGTHQEKRELVDRIRKVDPYVGILCDIQGPKIRVGEFKGEEPYNLNVGQKVRLYEKEIMGDETQFSIPLTGFLDSMKPGYNLYVNDGIIKIQVKEKKTDHLIGEVISGGSISDRKGVNIPSGELKQKVPTEKDVEDIKLIAELAPEFLAISFVSDGADVLQVRRIIENAGNTDVKLISKIERPVALDNFENILEVSDGIMVARGDLGVEISPDQVPLKQKEMIYKCNKEGKPVIVATQMLESMTNNPIPTRAEANDVFNAVLDGTDAVMLSAETAVGKYPINAVKYMNRIALTATENMPLRPPDEYDSDKLTHTQTIGHAIHALAKEMEDLNFRGKILVITRGGYGARMISKFRPPLPIIALTPHKLTARILNLVWGVQPVHIDKIDFFNLDVESIIEQSVKFAVETGAVDENEHVIILIVSRKFQKRGNLVGFYYVGEILDSSNN